MEADKERALSEREHLHTARAFSEAGNKVSELRTKLKSAINKSRYVPSVRTIRFVRCFGSAGLTGSHQSQGGYMAKCFSGTGL